MSAQKERCRASGSTKGEIEMQVSRILSMPLLCGALLGAGCTTTQTERRNAEMRQHSQAQNLQAELKRLQGRVDGLMTSQEDAYRKIEGLRRTVEGRETELDRRLRELSDGLASTATARETMKREIIDSVTRNVKDVIKQQAPPTARYSQRGVEHTVEAGQTLSAIASAYGVSTRVLVEANRLKNPDALREGQKLFIPE